MWQTIRAFFTPLHYAITQLTYPNLCPMHRIFVLAFLFFLQNGTQAQQFGGFAPRTRWQQIDTDTARIIFQSQSETQAQRIAALVHRMAATRPQPLGNRIDKINVVLHPNTTLANGYVGLGPWRSEFYLIPGSDIFAQGNVPWYEHLAIHEYRHVQQYSNMNRGLSKAFRVLLGEEGQAFANSLAVPNWFFEGDAVHSETVLTPQGRGRLPQFMSGPASIWLAGRNYSLMKWMNGSLKDYVPNHYQFGYLLTNYGYTQFGDAFWEKVVHDASAYRGLPTPMRSAVKKHSGMRFRNFVQEAFRDYREELPRPKEAEPKGLVRQQFFPQMIGQDSLLFLESSYRHLPRFVLQHNGQQKVLKLRHISSEDWFAYRNGKIVYTAYNTDARWSLTNYSNIVVLDMATGRERTLTKKRRYFTPDISPSGKKLAAIEIDSSTRSRLHLLDAETGELLQELTIGEGTMLLHPRFIDEETLVTVHRRRNGSMALHHWNLTTGAQEMLLYAGYNTLGYPFVSEGKIYFTSSASGTDDVYSFDAASGELQRLTETETGNYFVSAKGDNIYFAQFTANGLELQTGTAQGQPLAKEYLANERERFAPSSDSFNILQTPTQRFATKRYRKSTGLVNLHSWRPNYEDPEFLFSAYSQNVLNTLDATAYYRYNQNERSHGVGANIAYGGLYPVITGGAEYTFNRRLRTPRQTQLFDQAEANAGFYIPLNFSGGKTYKFLRFGSSVVVNRLMPSGKENPYQATTRTYLQHSVSFSHQLPRARQHIFPRWSLAIAPSLRHQLDGAGRQWLVNGQMSLPSIRNHSLVLAGSMQLADTGLVLFSNRFANARGYADYYLPRMWRVSANYHLPLFYPDWGFGGLLYFMRIRANLFYDYQRAWWPGRIGQRALRSTGTELFFDTKWMNQLDATIGLRYSYLLDEGFGGNGSRHNFSVVLPVDLLRQ